MLKPTQRYRHFVVVALIFSLLSAGCRQSQQETTSDGTPGTDANDRLACREFEPLARDVDKGQLSNVEFQAGVRRVYNTAVATPSDVSRRAETLLRVATQGGTAQQWRQALLDLAESCARVMKAPSPTQSWPSR